MPKIPGIFERPPDSGVFWIDYLDASGERRREKAGKLQAAMDLLVQRRAEVRRGDPIVLRTTRSWPFRKLAEEAIKHKALRLAPLTIATDRTRLHQLVPLLGRVPFTQVNPARIEAALAHLKASGRSNSTLNRYRSFMSSVFAWALDTGKVTSNPCTRVKTYKENDGRIRWLRPEEETRLRAVIGGGIREMEFDLAINTGMRTGEQFSLRWAEVDLAHAVLTVTGKTGRRHVVANEHAQVALRRLQEQTGDLEFVCPSSNAPADGPFQEPPVDLSKRKERHKWFRGICGEANVQNFRWHDLRHTFASRLVMAGVDIRTVQVLMGHASIVTTMKYAHLSSDHRQAAVAKLGGRGGSPVDFGLAEAVGGGA